jgi:hypothetical protein
MFIKEIFKKKKQHRKHLLYQAWNKNTVTGPEKAVNTDNSFNDFFQLNTWKKFYLKVRVQSCMSPDEPKYFKKINLRTTY